MTWEDAASWLARAGRRDAYDRAARWALDTLRRRLGDDWLARATANADGDVPFGLHLLGSHTLALVDALEWALRLQLADEWKGSATFLRDLRHDPRAARILHSGSQLAARSSQLAARSSQLAARSSQLAVAGLAERVGWGVELEPRRAGRAPADVAVTAPTGTLLTEIRVLTQSSMGRDAFAAVETGADWLMALGIEHDVWIGGELARHPSADERGEIESFVALRAAEARAGQRVTLSLDGITVELSGRDRARRALDSPAVYEDLFTRMVRVIARQGGTHADPLDGLRAWPLNPQPGIRGLKR